MEGTGFDEIVRRLGAGHSRRSVLRGLITGSGALVAGRVATVGAAQPKHQICHRTGNGSFQLITVAAPALDAHLAHGDGLIGSDTHCSGCGDSCGEGASCVDFVCVPDSTGGCPAGSAPDDDGACVPCGAGSVSSDGISCQFCAADTYADAIGQATCAPCPAGYTTNGAIGATACEPVETSDALICTAENDCQSQCPGASSPWCYCGTTFDTGENVCYSADNGCGGPYCKFGHECGDGYACVNLNGGCGGCDGASADETGQARGVCNRVCVNGD